MDVVCELRCCCCCCSFGHVLWGFQRAVLRWVIIFKSGWSERSKLLGSDSRLNLALLFAASCWCGLGCVLGLWLWWSCLLAYRWSIECVFRFLFLLFCFFLSYNSVTNLKFGNNILTFLPKKKTPWRSFSSPQNNLWILIICRRGGQKNQTKPIEPNWLNRNRFEPNQSPFQIIQLKIFPTRTVQFSSV